MRTASAVVLVAALAAACQPHAGSPTGAPFNARPTQPLECASVVANRPAGSIWYGRFSGRKEVDRGFIRYLDTRQAPCFLDERSCRNWLYNMQSEYTVFVWTAECRRG